MQLRWRLHKTYPRAPRIHLTLENFSIHSSAEVHSSLNTPVDRRFVLHFLPQYCLDHNKIERVRQDLHANDTRNNRCLAIADLIRNFHSDLNRRHRTSPKGTFHTRRPKTKSSTLFTHGDLECLALILFVCYLSPGIRLREFAGRMSADLITGGQQVSRGRVVC